MSDATPDARLGAIEVRLATMEAILTELKHRLLGNGQPGELTVLQGRVTVMEAFLNKVAGIGAFIGLALAVGEFLLHLRGRP